MRRSERSASLGSPVPALPVMDSTKATVVRNQRRKGQLFSCSEICIREITVCFEVVLKQGLLVATVTFVARTVMVAAVTSRHGSELRELRFRPGAHRGARFCDHCTRMR